jgi:hypothetical protein
MRQKLGNLDESGKSDKILINVKRDRGKLITVAHPSLLVCGTVSGF